jgi:hypothetical protein
MIVKKLHNTLMEHLRFLRLSQDGDVQPRDNDIIPEATGYAKIEIAFGDNCGNIIARIT